MKPALEQHNLRRKSRFGLYRLRVGNYYDDQPSVSCADLQRLNPQCRSFEDNLLGKYKDSIFYFKPEWPDGRTLIVGSKITTIYEMLHLMMETQNSGKFDPLDPLTYPSFVHTRWMSWADPKLLNQNPVTCRRITSTSLSSNSFNESPNHLNLGG